MAVTASDTGNCALYVLKTPELLFCMKMTDQVGSVKSGACAGDPLCDKNLQAL